MPQWLVFLKMSNRVQAVYQGGQRSPGDGLVHCKGGLTELAQDLDGVDKLGPVGGVVPPQEAWLTSLELLD